MSEPKTLAQILVSEIKKRIKELDAVDLGVVTAIHLTSQNKVQSYTADVVLRDTGDITSYSPNPLPNKTGLRFQNIPIASIMRGQNFGVFAIPKIGQTVVLAFLNQQLEQPVIIGMLDLWFDDTAKKFKDNNLPPVNFGDGDFLIYPEKDTIIKMELTKSVGTGQIPGSVANVTITNTRVTANSRIFLQGLDANSLSLWPDNIIAGTSFRVNRPSAPSTPANFQYLIIDGVT